MAEGHLRSDEVATTGRKIVLALVAVPIAAAAIHCLLSPPASHIEQWLGLISLRRETIKAFLAISTILGILLSVLEFVFGRKNVADTLVLAAGYVEGGAPAIRAAAGTVRRYMHRTVVATATSPGSPWWEDGPVYGLFFWLAWGPPSLEAKLTRSYEYFIREPLLSLPSPSVDVFVGVPFLVVELVFSYFLVIWLWRCARILFVLVGGVFYASEVKYREWCGLRIRVLNERFDHSHFDNVMGDSTEKRRGLRPIGLGGYLFAYLVLLSFCWFIWPALIYLLALSFVFWFVSQLLKLVATLCVLGVRFSRLPRAGPIITLFSLPFDLCLGLH
jgi:hypothetical protein